MGGLLIIDYGYTEKKMKDTLQAISNHKFAKILDNICNVDITHNINFELFSKFIKKIGNLESKITTQKKFLIEIGIKQRAEIISKNLSFSQKADVYYRLQKIIDKKYMGDLFKVMLVKKNKNNFQLGFNNW